MLKTHYFWRLTALAALCCSLPVMAADTPYQPSAGERLVTARKAIEARDWRTALWELRGAELDEPRNADVQNLLGYTVRKSEPPDLPRAFEHYKRALQIDPLHKGALEYIGEAYLMVNQPEEARKHLAQLATACGNTTCEEYVDLAKAIEAYQAQKR